MAGAAGVPGARWDSRGAEEEGWDRVAVAGSCPLHPADPVRARCSAGRESSERSISGVNFQPAPVASISPRSKTSGLN